MGAVRRWFNKFKILPPRNLMVGTTKTPSGPASFETLLRGIAAEAGEQQFVVVVHGHEDGTGLFLPLANRGRAKVGENTTHDRLERLMAIADRNPARIDQGDRDLLGLRDAEINRLLEVRRTILAKKIKVIEFRGCNLGRKANSVAEFRKFFGAQSFGAPNLHSFFGANPTGTGAHLMQNHVQSHDGTTFVYRFTIAQKTCICCIGVNDQRKPRNGHVIADDGATLESWIQQNLAANGTHERGNLPVHGLWLFPPPDPNDPLSILPDPRPVFPLARDGNGDNEYQRHIVYSP
jgi:hypothetical protein